MIDESLILSANTRSLQLVFLFEKNIVFAEEVNSSVLADLRNGLKKLNQMKWRLLLHHKIK